jgi:hypothetical protein
MADMRINNAIAIVMLNALVDEIDTGGAGTIEIRTGGAPATCETADSGTLLGTLTFGGTAFGAASDGTDKATVTANSITDESSAPNGGTAAHFRVKNGSGTVVLQGTVTGTGGGGDMELSNTTVVASDTISIGTSYTIDLPET